MGTNPLCVKVGSRSVGEGQPCYVVAEIGINHNGSLDTAKRLIQAACEAGCDAVKFQKRTVEVVYCAEELARPRQSPFGSTNGDLKRGLEFDEEAYAQIDAFCRSLKIAWFASAWDEASADLIARFDVPLFKIASASLTDDNLLRHIASKGKPIFLSTGMSTLAEIDHALVLLGKDDLVLMHTTSTYPTEMTEVNLKVIPALQARYAVPVGYSGHEAGLAASLAAVAMGACCLERHITLDRAMWGSDQHASLEPDELKRLVQDVRTCQTAMGDGFKRVYDSEIGVLKKLRRVGAAI
jgi:N-acetylneuraminate synthase